MVPVSYSGPSWTRPANGLSFWHALWWRNLWESSEYEPDPTLNYTYGGGAIASLGDCFIWGTIHVPLLTAQVHILLYGEPQTDDEQLAVYLNTLRTTSVFRGRLVRRPGLWGWLTPDFEYELLYGQEQFTIWNPDLGTNGEWETVDNASGLVPLYGPSGFETAPYPPPYNISYNFYLWSGAALDGQGYFGTLDLYDNSSPSGWRGADLWRFPSCNEPAVAEFRDGGDNRRSYGIRTMVTDENVLFMGMASSDNLRTVYNGSNGYGGWRLLKGTPED